MTVEKKATVPTILSFACPVFLDEGISGDCSVHTMCVCA